MSKAKSTLTVPSSIHSLTPDSEKPQPTIKVYVEPECTLPFWRKAIILFVASLMCLVANFSSTCLYPATSEIATEFNTTSDYINAINSLVVLVAGFSSVVWVPLVMTFSRRTAYNASILVLLICSIATAVSTNIHMFIAFRLLAAVEVTFYQVIGQTIIADVFSREVRGTAIGVWMIGPVAGPSLGALIGGVIISFTTWRVIFYVQTALVALGLVLSLLFVPSIAQTEYEEVKPSVGYWAKVQWKIVARVAAMMCTPSVLLGDIAGGLLNFEQYSFLASPRHLINPRFHLTSPLLSGLFYLSPGAGFILGSMVGGKYSDITMAKQIKARNGDRVPSDRLQSGLWAFLIALPAAQMIYGWCLEEEVGGIAVVIVAAFFVGFFLMAAFASLNTYLGEAVPEERLAAITSKYIVGYGLGAAGNAAVIPFTDAVGIGWFSTLTSGLAIFAGFLVFILVRYGPRFQRQSHG